MWLDENQSSGSSTFSSNNALTQRAHSGALSDGKAKSVSSNSDTAAQSASSSQRLDHLVTHRNIYRLGTPASGSCSSGRSHGNERLHRTTTDNTAAAPTLISRRRAAKGQMDMELPIFITGYKAPKGSELAVVEEEDEED